MFEDEDGYLEHYGIRGMKWGVRKQLARRNSNSKHFKAYMRGSLGDKNKSLKDKILDDLDIPGRPNRRSNTISDEQKAFENSKTVKAGQLLLAAALAAYGGYRLNQLRKL